MTLTLRSPAFEPGAPIPARFDHEQGDQSPALAWDGVPKGTAALVLLVDDPDAPIEGSFVHWVLYNLDPARQGIAEGEEPAEAAAGANGFGRPGYLGPAPPPGDGPHHYIFRLLAVDQPVPLMGLPSYQDVGTAVTGHILGEARLIGTYQRQPELRVRTEALATNVPPLQAIDPAMIAVSNGSSAADRDQEIDRLLALGARRVDSGQTGAESQTVLADPEGNELCVVRPKETLIG